MKIDKELLALCEYIFYMGVGTNISNVSPEETFKIIKGELIKDIINKRLQEGEA